jgi:glycerol-3-phosphate dehydrogenase
MNGQLSPDLRAAVSTELSRAQLDVLVIGGGVVGAGAALDAVTRGLSVGLIEMRDWAAGTSSRSSKLIHGGLRYLGTLDFSLVREAAYEQSLLVDRIAPHLVHRVPFLYPLRHGGWERALLGAEMVVYDAVAQLAASPRSRRSYRHLSKRSLGRIAPALRLDELTGAVQYYGAQVDDARYVLTLVRTAAAYGAMVGSRIRARELMVESGRVVGVRVDDLTSGRRHEIRAKVVVSATGVWTDQTIQMIADAGLDRIPTLRVKGSKGVHLVVPLDRIRSSTGLISRTDTSVLLVVPWGRHWIIGTTDTAWSLDRKSPAATAVDIDYLLTEVNRILRAPLSLEDVESCYAGVWALPSNLSAESSQIARERIVTRVVPCLVMVAGGTYSTYRVMAANAIDEAAKSLGGLISESITEKVPLLGADGYYARWNQRHLLARRAGLQVARVEHLLNRYGAMADQLLDLVARQPELAAPLPGAETIWQ